MIYLFIEFKMEPIIVLDVRPNITYNILLIISFLFL